MSKEREGKERGLRWPESSIRRVAGIGLVLLAIVWLPWAGSVYGMSIIQMFLALTLGGGLAVALVRIESAWLSGPPEAPLRLRTLSVARSLRPWFIAGHLFVAIVLLIWAYRINPNTPTFPWPILAGPAYGLYLAVRAALMCSADRRRGRWEELKLSGFVLWDVYRARITPVMREGFWAAAVIVAMLMVMFRGEIGDEMVSFVSVNWWLIGLLLGSLLWAGALALTARSMTGALGLALVPPVVFAGVLYLFLRILFWSRLTFLDRLFDGSTTADLIMAFQFFSLPLWPGPVTALLLSRDLRDRLWWMIPAVCAGIQLLALGISLILTFVVNLLGELLWFKGVYEALNN